MATEYAQDKFLKNVVGYDDDAQRQVNREANPKSSFAGGMAGGMATMSPVAVGETLAKRAMQRGAGAAAMGGFEAGGEYLQGEEFDPQKIAMAAAFGGVAPGVNKLGAKVQGPAEKYLAGRPGRTPNPAADQAHEDVGDDTVETAVGDSALTDGPPRPTGDTVGTPDANRPTNSQGEVATGTPDASYAKGKVPQDSANDMLTQGDMDPATKAALTPEPEAAPAPAQQPEPEQQPAAPPPVQPPEAVGAPSQEAPQVVDAGFPKPGEAVAAGENDATAMPANTPERTAAAIKRSMSVQPAGNKVRGKTAPNDTVSDAQKEAGNYPKEHSHDFGKPTSMETEAGDVRRGKNPDGTDWENVSPYDYGYFNKTKSTDGEGIDWARPKADAPERGDKHFIIDQKDATTGKYDEPKVFRDVKDRDTAVDLYNRGFSDGKGPDRMHDISEVNRGQLVNYLRKHSASPPTGPYSKKPLVKAPKPLAERAVVKDLIEKGKLTEEQVKALPPEQIAAAIDGKRLRKYGVETGASAGYPVEGLVNSEGKPVTANTKAKAAERAGAHKKVADWFEESKPSSQMDTSKETDGETLDRVKGLPDLSGWQPAFKPKEWMLAREAKRVLAKPTPKALENFRETERLLRGGDASVQAYRDSNRVEADVARSNRGGDEKISDAENKLHQPGQNSVEDEALAAIDAKNKGRFDVPHEEAETMVKATPVKSREDLKELPRKTIDVKDSALTKVDLKKVDEGAARRRAEAEALMGKKSTKSTAASEGKASERKKATIDIGDPEEMKKLIEMSNKAAKKSSLSDEEINQSDLTKQAAVIPRDGGEAVSRKFFDKPEPTDGGIATTKRLIEAFGADEAGSLNLGKIRADIAKLLKTTNVKSYRAREAKSPGEEHGNALSDDLNTVDRNNTRHKVNMLEWSHDVPATKDQLSEIYHARDADSAHVDLPGKVPGKTNVESLSPELKKIWDDHLEPKAKEVNDFKDAIRKLDPDRLGPDVEHYQSRIVKGDTSEYNMLKANDDPTGPSYNGLSVNASMANERPFVALERVSDGKRFVIQNHKDGGGFTIWDNYKGARIKDPGYEFEANQPYTVKSPKGDHDFIMREATTKEIEANARGRDGKGKPMKYFDNAALSIGLAHAKLGTMARNLTELARITSTPEFNALTTRNPATAKEKGWIETTMPNFKGLHMDPSLAHVFNDYAKSGFDIPSADRLRALNQGVTKLLFWMPTAHIANVGTHWFVGRGWDWINPVAYKELAVTGARAIKSVMSQDHYQTRLSEGGAGTIYPSVMTRDFIEHMAKNVGEAFEREPSKYGKIADTLGVPLKKLTAAIYDNSSKVMWAANDMFLTQRIMELERKGHSVDQAIKQAERDIPNYRVPPTIGGSRFASQFMQDPLVTSFGRYHFGMWNSYANIVKDAVGTHSSPGDRVDAIGKMFAMGILAYGVYPALDKVAQAVTGNDEASANRRGPISIPHHLGRALEGKEGITSAGRASLTIPPAVATVSEALNNKDWRDKAIVEPGDVKAGAQGDLRRGGRAVVQEAAHFARGLVSPLSTLASAEKKYKDDSGAVAGGKAVRDQALDIHNPSDAASKYERKQGITNDRAARTREMKGGHDFLEDTYNKLTGGH